MKRERIRFVVLLLAGATASMVPRSSADPVSVKSKAVSAPAGKRTESIKINRAYYVQLRKLCGSKASVSCCLSSVSAMQRGNFVAAPGPGCPEGTFQNKLRCKDSLTWCEPPKKEEPEERIHLKSPDDQKNEKENKEGR